MVFLKVLTIAAIAAVGMLASVGTQLTYGLGSINSQGVQAHQSDPWNEAGFNGEGIKVGIIENSGEGGFLGYHQLIGTELPTGVEARCYTRIGQFVSDIGICDTGGDHGTNVAETVADIAPEVSLYIANPGTAADLRSTVNWMVSEGVSVINHSAVWTFGGPPDGSWDYPFSVKNSVKRAMGRRNSLGQFGGQRRPPNLVWPHNLHRWRREFRVSRVPVQRHFQRYGHGNRG